MFYSILKKRHTKFVYIYLYHLEQLSCAIRSIFKLLAGHCQNLNICRFYDFDFGQWFSLALILFLFSLLLLLLFLLQLLLFLWSLLFLLLLLILLSLLLLLFLLLFILLLLVVLVLVLLLLLLFWLLLLLLLVLLLSYYVSCRYYCSLSVAAFIFFIHWIIYFVVC